MFAETKTMKIESTSVDSDEDDVDYWVAKGACPGCGGKGVRVEKIELKDQNN